ncbi:MAG: hypothetical protein AAF939_14010 [Planctomycetota bacterium]
MPSPKKRLFVPVCLIASLVLVVHLVLSAVLVLPELPSDQEQENGNPQLKSLGKMDSDLISESSGLAWSYRYEDCFWTHNDSGHSADVYLLHTSGKVLAQVQLENANNRDWEAMTRFEMDGVGYIMVGDVGDNLEKCGEYILYYFKEPRLERLESGVEDSYRELTDPIKTTLRTGQITFRYPDGSKNCEAIAVDDITQSVWLVEKVYFSSSQKTAPGVYRVPIRFDPKKPVVTAERVGSFPVRNVTGMAFSPDQNKLLIRNYLTGDLYQRHDGESWKQVLASWKPVSIPLPIQRQGEAVCFTPDSKSVIVSSEHKRQSIWRITVEPYFDLPRKKRNVASRSK